MNKPNKQDVGNAGEYYIASVLSANGFKVSLLLGNTEKYDLLTISPEGKKSAIQVKTSYGSRNYWQLTEKNEKVGDFFYAFVKLNNLKNPFEFWIIPSKIVSEKIKLRHKKWMKTPNRKGGKHNPNPRRAFIIGTTNTLQENSKIWNGKDIIII